MFPLKVPYQRPYALTGKKNKVDKWTTTSLAKDLNSDGTCRCHCKATGKQLEVVSTRIVVRGGLEC